MVKSFQGELGRHAIYAVRTTGVYCRPTCSARAPLPRNVVYFDSPAEAEAAGFRPCRRCRPEQEGAVGDGGAAMVEACRAIERAVSEGREVPGLAQLAAGAGLSAGHFQRRFVEAMGVSPKAYATALRDRQVRGRLAGSDASVTEAIYEAGFGSGSRFYESSGARMGMAPTAWRRGGAGAEIRFAVGQCSLGALLVASTHRGVCAIALGDDAEVLVRELQEQFPQAQLIGADRGFEALVAQVVGMIETPGAGPEVPLDVRATAFQERVWRALRRIPAGRTATYAEIAARLGRPGAARAVARACASNPVAVAIPCHRVVRTDGEVSGYRWGIARKQALLEREQGGAS